MENTVNLSSNPFLRLWRALRHYGVIGALRRIIAIMRGGPAPQPLPYRGAVSEVALLGDGRVRIQGWGLGPKQVNKVIFTAGTRQVLPPERRVVRPDLRAKFPEYDEPAGGFSLHALLPEGVGSGTPYEVELLAGSRRVFHTTGTLAAPHRIEGMEENDQRLAAYRDRHKGARAFLLGNGPSIRYEDLELMAGDVVFAANRFYMAYPEMAMRPTYTVCLDLLVLKKHGPAIATECGTPLFIAERAENSADLRRGHPNVISFRETPVYPSDDPADYTFSADPVEVMGFGFGVIYGMLQLAVWMGIREIYLYGIDHTFTLPKDYVRPGQVVTHQGEPNHFIKGYREIGEKWAPPNYAKTEAAFHAARIYCEARGIPIWNATRGGKLEVFPRRDIDEALRPSRPATVGD